MNEMQAYLTVQGIKAAAQRLGRLVKAEGINPTFHTEVRQLADANETLAKELVKVLKDPAGK